MVTDENVSIDDILSETEDSFPEEEEIIMEDESAPEDDEYIDIEKEMIPDAEKDVAEELTGAFEDEPALGVDLDSTTDEPSAEPEAEIPEEEPANPMAELQNISAETVSTQAESFEKLKTLSKKIIDGEAIDLGLNIKSEIKELLDLILETKKRVDDIGPSLATSNEHIPNVLNTLESVSETTEDATLSLMENSDGLNNYYQEFIEEINDLEDLVYKKDTGAILKKIAKLESDLEQADSMGYNILHALEFQDVTEQKLQKVINAVRDIGARLGAILGFIKLKQEQDPTVADDASQDDIDKLLADFGLD